MNLSLAEYGAVKFAKTLLLLLALGLVLAGCRTPLKTDAEIGADIRREIDSLNRYLIAALRDQKTMDILKLGSSDFQKTDSVWIKLRQISKGAKGLKLGGHKVEHQIFSDKLRADSTTAVRFREGTEEEYSFGFYQSGHPTVASFIVIPEDRRELSLVTVFSKERNVWKLTALQIGVFRVQGLSAVDWFLRARQQDEAGAQVDALISQSMALETLNPGGENISYRMSDMITQQSYSIEARARGSFRFPIVVDPEQGGSPRIIGVQMDCDSVSCIPSFTLQTNTALDDTAELNKECRYLTTNLDKWFSGVSNRNKMIAVQLVNKEYFDESDPTQFRVLRVPTVADWRY